MPGAKNHDIKIGIAQPLGRNREMRTCIAPLSDEARPLPFPIASLTRHPEPITRSVAMNNRVLAALPSTALLQWLPYLEVIDMPKGKVLCESGGVQTHVYFPTTAIVSLLCVLESGATAEVAIVGPDGLVGISVFMGGGSTPNRAVVQTAGLGLRLPARVLLEGFHHHTPVTNLMLRYTQALITQTAQNAVCNRHHSLKNQLSRWLLMNLDRLNGNRLIMTQEMIAHLLGVRREGVTEAALKLQRDGLITYARGHITVLDRPGLEVRCCECYAVVKQEYDRLLPAASTS